MYRRIFPVLAAVSLTLAACAPDPAQSALPAEPAEQAAAALPPAADQVPAADAPAPEEVAAQGAAEVSERVADLSARADALTKDVDALAEKVGRVDDEAAEGADEPAPAEEGSAPQQEAAPQEAQAGEPIMSPGDQNDQVQELQGRLRPKGWFAGTATGTFGPQTHNAVRGFQAKEGLAPVGYVDAATWEALVAATDKPEPEAEPVQQPEQEFQADERCMSGRVICISKAQSQLAWMVDGKVQFTMDVRFGPEAKPTKNGEHSVTRKSKDHVSSVFGSPMPYSLFFYEGQAVHYSEDFATNGYRGASHGCVNVRDMEAAKQLFEVAEVGDQVIVFS